MITMTDYITRIREAITEELNDSDRAKPLDVHINKDKSVSIALKSVLVAKIHFRVKSSSFMEIVNKYANLFPESSILSADAHWCKIKLLNKDDVFKYITQLVSIYNNLLAVTSGEQFGCCSRFMECSDAKKCIHSDALFAAACIYRRNLEDGKIFYGKNRNV